MISSSSMPAACAIIGTVAPQAMIEDVGVLEQRPCTPAAGRCPSRPRSRPRSWCSRAAPSARTVRTSEHRPISVIGNRSLAKPGIDAGGEARRSARLARLGDRARSSSAGSASSPATPTASSRSSRRRCRRAGTRLISADVVVGVRARSGRSAPARRACSAISASTSSVAARPSGSARPQISPTSRPTLSGLLTPTPTSSNTGCFDDLGDHHLADEAGAPHHDSLGHPLPSTRPPSWSSP